MTRQPTLHVCRTVTEACLGAAAQDVVGLVVTIFEEDGLTCARQATSSIFGLINRRADAVEKDYLRSLVCDTLEIGDQDVWLASSVPGITDTLVGFAENTGFRVSYASGQVPETLLDPYQVFIRKTQPKTTEVLSFCQVDPQDAEMAVGDILRMDCVFEGPGCNVVYLTESGIPIGSHGSLPFPIDEYGIERLREVRAMVSYVNWGRGWRNGRLVPLQTIVFNIPNDVAAMLEGCSLSLANDRNHL